MSALYIIRFISESSKMFAPTIFSPAINPKHGNPPINFLAHPESKWEYRKYMGSIGVHVVRAASVRFGCCEI